MRVQLFLAGALAIALTACSGDKGAMGVHGTDGAVGDKGATGTPGKNGVDGKNGTNGMDGKSIYRCPPCTTVVGPKPEPKQRDAGLSSVRSPIPTSVMV